MQLRKHGTSRYRSGGTIGPARWTVYDLIVLLEGSFTFHTPWQEREVIAGDAVLIPPGVAFHATAGRHGGEVWVGHFSLGKSGSRNEFAWLRSPAASPAWHLPAAATSPWAKALLARISAIFPEGGARDESHQLFGLLLESIRSHSAPSSPSPIQQALAEAAGCGWKGVTLERLAAWAGYSPSHFRARFEQELGEPAGRYLRHRRLEAACHLLRDASLPIKQIADRLGYSTPSAFHHAFHNVHGCTPGEYRRRTAVRF